ncbi:hypothetical protein Tco_0803063 [Tanacetum coccineum]|uniref:Retrotransposon gag domain-containing protein n=1 Tax=Tanacetum coccineum TaxID=301880 RepID=A0ABQ5A1G6_9ASTR
MKKYEETDSDILYAISIKEDTAYLCLHFTRNHEESKSNTAYPEDFHTPSPEFDLFSDLEEHTKEEVAEKMAETMEEYMCKTRGDYGSGVTRPKMDDKDHFELKGQFLKELRDNTFSGSDHEDANEHIEKVLEIVDLFHIPNITQDQIMLRSFPVSPTKAANRWLRNTQSGSIKTWEDLKAKFLRNIGKIQRTIDEMPSTLLNGDAGAIQEMAEYSQKWHHITSRTRSTETSDGLAVIQAQLNKFGREIKKVNEKVYAAQVGCELCKGPCTPKIVHLKKKEKPLKKHIILNLVYLSNKEGNIEQQLRDSTKEIMQTLRAKMLIHLNRSCLV